MDLLDKLRELFPDNFDKILSILRNHPDIASVGGDEDDGCNIIEPTLIQQLKNVLQQYPDNGQILKEIIQNAEDAGATKVCFLYDENDVSTIFTQRTELRGPSLYSYNDASFSKEDWRGIRMLGKSNKEKDPLKIGKFGLGFKSTFHLTDNATIFSGSTMLTINPDGRLFSSDQGRATGNRINFTKEPDKLENLKKYHTDCCDMYRDILGTDIDIGRCDGTLFRFPLRKEPSELSTTIYEQKKIYELFKSFQSEGHIALLFMRSLRKVEFFVREYGEEQAKLISSFCLDVKSDDALGKMEKFSRTLREASRTSIPVEDSIAYQATVSVYEIERPNKVFNYFIIHHYAGKTLAEGISVKNIASDLGLMPIVGLAFPRSQDLPTKGGHIFCTLPLPVLETSATSLPVHVNGYFALGPDRKDLKWPGVSEIKCSDQAILWNQFLIQDVLPEAYKILISNILIGLKKEEVYSFFPDLSIVDKKWRILAEKFFQQLFDVPCVWTPASGGKWILPIWGIFEGKKERSGAECAFQCLINCNQNVVRLPPHVASAFEKLYTVSRRFMEPSLVRRELGCHPQVIDKLEYKQRMELLPYILSSVDDLKALVGVSLLPLENGTFSSVKSTQEEKIYITTPQHPKELLPGFEGRILKTNIDEGVLDIFQSAAFEGVCQLEILGSDTIVRWLNDTIGKRDLQLSSEWLDNIWRYIQKNELTQRLHGLSLIPLQKRCEGDQQVIKCGKISENSTIVYMADDNENIKSLILHLGFTVVRDLPQYILEYGELFNRYILKFGAKNIFRLLQNLSDLKGIDHFVKQFNSYGDDEAKVHIRRLIYKAPKTLPKDKDLARRLQIFENTHTSQITRELSCIEEIELLAPENLPEIKPKRKLLNCQDEDSRNLARKLGARLLTEKDLISEVLIPEIVGDKQDYERIDKFMNYILPHITFCVPAELSELREIEFVSALDGSYHKARDLFDPSNESLQFLFSHDKGKFPDDKYERMKYSTALKNLGLKSFNLSAQDIIGIVESIDFDEKKAETLVNFLESNHCLLEDESIVSALKDLFWIPVMKTRIDGYPKKLTWYGEKVTSVKTVSFARPCTMASEANAKILGAVKPVYSSHYATQYMAKCFFKNEFTLDDVIGHLQHVVNDYEESEKPYYGWLLQDVYRKLLMYEFHDVESSLLRHSLRGWVWNGIGFTSPDRMIVEADKNCLDLRPYFWSVLPEMQSFQELLLKLGSHERYTHEIFIQVLSEMKNRCDHASLNCTQITDPKDLNLAVDIVTELSNEMLPQNVLDKLAVPVRSAQNSLKLELANNTVYCSSHASDDLEFDSDENTAYLHEHISEAVATKLGIRSITSKMLEAEDLGLFEEYGQTEPLTRRINRILQDYGDGSAILKELVQNADDAEATDVKLLYDERENEKYRSRLIDPEMKDFQGPALWAYNDAVFSKSDFENITKLSGATKESQRDKIGKFGLGFNAVYNITDVPSFISDNNLVIFDPHTNNLGAAISNKSKPGVKIDIGKNRGRLKPFIDQLMPYNGVFGIDMSLQPQHREFKGTLFRFPLRTKDQAVRSEIKNLWYTDLEMKKLLEKFSAEANRFLLFTQHVRSITVYHLAANATNPVEMTELIAISKENKKEVIPLVFDGRLFNSSEFMKLSSKAVEKCKRVPESHCSIDCCNIVNMETRRCGQHLFDGKNVQCTNADWLIHTTSGSRDTACLQMALDHEKLNPVASVAVSIHIESGGVSFHPLGRSGNPGYYFCFLPLPVANNLPVHVNAPFAVTHDRKSLQQVNEDNKDNSTSDIKWNDALMAGVVSAAYLKVLENLKNQAKNFEEADWYLLWPITSSGFLPYQFSLLQSFYQRLVHDTLKMFPVIRETIHWAYMQEVLVVDNLLDEDITHSMEEIINLYIKDRYLVHLPASVIKTILGVKLQRELQEIKFEYFFLNIFKPNVKDSEMPTAIREHVVLYLMQNLESYQSLKSVLQKTECVPTLPNGALKSPEGLVKPNSKASMLFEDTDGVFPLGKNFNQKFHLTILESLGMISEHLSWEVLEERAQTIILLENGKIARKRSKALIKIIDEKLKKSNRSLNEISLNWRSIKFLPIKASPTEWDLPWAKTSSEHFHCIKGIYPNCLEELVCFDRAIIDESNEGCGKLSNDFLNFFEIPSKAVLSQVLMQADHLADLCLEDVSDNVKKVLCKIYAYLNRFFCEKINEKLGEESEQLAEIQEVWKRLKGKPLIIIDSKLAQAERIAFKHDYLTQPYLYQLPKGLWEYRQLMIEIGVKETFDPDDYMSALQRLESDRRNNPLNSKEMHIVRDLLELIVNFEQFDNISLPDTRSILYPAQEIHVKDAMWIQDDLNLRYIHSNIPVQLALKFGAKTVRSHSITKQSIGLPFGQHEKLTVRLKKILDGYSENINILKEILQNADDARAKKLSIMLDRRHHASERVFSDTWKELQGPALLFCNDAMFTESDLQGIQNLGEGSKSSDPMKTGKFGVGFNVVYHVTDVPTLLTYVEGEGSVLCVFDPHAKYLGECTLESPGRKFSDARNFLKDNFPDVYNTFIPDVFRNEKSTIFRLPLRNNTMAKQSNIMKKAITVDDVDKMLESLKLEVAECMIFLRNIEMVEIRDINTEGKVSVKYSALLKVLPEGRKERCSLNKECELVASQLDRQREDIPGEFPIHSYEIGLEDRGTYDEWHVIQKCAPVSSNALPSSVNAQYDEKQIKIFPSGGIACKKNSCQEGKVFCLLPLQVPSNLPLHINGSFMLDYETRRRLSYSKEDCFQNDWNVYIMESCIIPCYIALLEKKAKKLELKPSKLSAEEIIKQTCPALYLGNYRSSSLLTKNPGISNKHPKELQNYFDLFPVFKFSNQSFDYHNKFLNIFYNHLATSNVELLPVLRSHKESQKLDVDFCSAASTQKPFYIPGDLSNLGGTTSSEDDFQRIFLLLLRAGMFIYNVPQSITCSFEKAEVPLSVLSPNIVMEYLRTNARIILPTPMPVSETILKDVGTVKALLKYCLSKDKKLKDLDGLPLLVTEDNVIRAINKREQIYFDNLSRLFPSKKSICLHPDLRQVLSRFKHQAGDWLRVLTLDSLRTFCEEELCPSLRSNDEIQLETNAQVFPTDKWLSHLWTFLQKEHERMLEEHRKQEFDRMQQAQEEMKPYSPQFCAKEHFKDFLQYLSDWCFFPVKREMTEQSKSTVSSVIKIGLISTMVWFDDSSYRKSLQNSSLRDEISLPYLDKDRIDSHGHALSYTMYNSAYIEKSFKPDNSANSFLNALCYELKRKDSTFRRMESTTANNILEFFNGERGYNTNRLKTLPIFVDTCKQLRAIDNTSDVYIVEDGIPRYGLNLITGVVFLEPNVFLGRLFHQLEIKTISTRDIYTRYIIRCFNDFTFNQRLEHCIFLRDNAFNFVDEDKKHFHDLVFMCSKGSVWRANQFYDPEIDVFNLMLSETEFPPEPFNDTEWYPFLRQCGLQTSVSSSLFLKLATDVAKLGLSETEIDAGRRNSKVLVDYLYNSNDNLQKDISFLEKLRSIKFLIQDDLDEDLKSIYNNDHANKKICFQDAIYNTVQNVHLSWTVGNILPRYACKFSDFMLFSELESRLQIMEKVSQLTVAKNLVNIVTQSPLLKRLSNGVKELDTQRYKTRRTIETVFVESYSYLSHPERCHEVISLLQEHCVIFIDSHKFVIPSKTTLEEVGNITPYLFCIPHKHGQFYEFFQTLGTTKLASSQQFAGVLNELYTSSRGEGLHPNESDIAYIAASGLSKSMKRERESNTESFSINSLLYLPGHIVTEKVVKLFGSKNLVYFDDRHYEDRIKQLKLPRLEVGKEYFKENDLKMLVQFLPSNMKPKLISELIFEKLLDDNVVQDGNFSKVLKNRVESQEFISSLMRLLQHQLKSNPEDSCHLHLDDIAEVISATKVITLMEVKTALFVAETESHEEHVIEGSESNRDIFVGKDNKTLNIYIAGEHITSTDAVNLCIVATEISKLFRKYFTDPTVTPLLSGLLSCDPEKMQEFLDGQNILRGNEAIRRTPSIYNVGEFVPLELHCMLINEIFRFEIGEYVAYEVEDPLENDAKGEATFIYAKIVKLIEKEGDVYAKTFYEIEFMEGEFKTVNCCELYRFERQQEAPTLELFPDDRVSAHPQVTVDGNLEEILHSIKKELESAFNENREYFRKIVKRLYLRWHPDKNPGNEEICKTIFQYIQNEAERLEETSLGTFFSFYYNRETRFNSNRTNFRSGRSGNWFRGSSGRGFWHSSSGRSNPQPAEARRWFRQAQFDFEAAKIQIDVDYPEWTCLKCHQAAEKGLKSAVHAIDGKRLNEHNLSIIASYINDCELSRLAGSLEALLGSSTKLRYPDRWCYPDIPHTKYDKEMAKQALDITRLLMEKVKMLLSNKNTI